MAIGRISGSVLKSNLTRNGTDLAFETNLLYLDVTNNRIGIGTSEPSQTLHVSGTTLTTDLTVSGDATVQGSILADRIQSTGSNADITLDAQGTGSVNINSPLVINGSISTSDSTTVMFDSPVSVQGGQVATLANTTANQVVATNSTNTALVDSGMIYNSTSQSLGIGVASASDIDARLHIVGTGTANNREVLFKVNNSNDHDRIEFIDEADAGNLPSALRNRNATRGIGLIAESGPVTLYSGGSAASDAGLIVNTNGSVDIPGELQVDRIISTGSNANIKLDPQGTGVVDVSSTRITNVTDPSADQDAATKAYVDSQLSAADTLQEITDNGATTTNETTFSGGIITNKIKTSDSSSLYINSPLRVDGLGDQNEIVVVGANGLLTSSALLTIDTNNERIGIGTTSPARTFHLVGESQFEASMRIDQYHNSNDGPDILLQKARGNVASPAASQSGDELGKINAYGHDGTAFRISAQFRSVDNGSQGGDWQFYTGESANGSVQRLVIDHDGTVIVRKDLDVQGTLMADRIQSTGSNEDIVLDPQGTGVVNVSTSKITNVTDPTSDQDAATKAYVDAQVTASDLDFTADDSTTNSIDLDSEVMRFSGGTGITTSAINNTVTTSIDSTVATLTGTQTLENKTLRAPTFESGSNSPEFLEQRFVNATQQNFVQLYTGGNNGTYFTQGEYQKIATITPTGNAQNYTFIIRMTATSASNYQIVTFSGALRSNNLPDLSFTTNYYEEHNGTRFIEPKLWTKETTTAGFILAFEYIHNDNLYGGVNVEATIIPRSDDQRDNVSFNTTQDSEITSIDTGFTENDPTLIYANVSGTLEFGTQFRIEGSTADGNELTITATDPTADRTATFPDATGNVVLDSATQTLTNKTLTTPTISGKMTVDEIKTSDSSSLYINSPLRIDGLGEQNEIIIVGANGLLTSTSTLTIDDGNNYIGINQTSPAVTLHMTGEGAQSAQIRMEQHNDSGDAPDIRTRKSRGTAAAPTINNAGDFIFRGNFERYDGSAYDTVGQLAVDTNSGNQNRFQLTLTVSEDGNSIDAADAQFKIDGNDSGAITFNNAYKFPTADGSNGQALITDGSGTLSFGGVTSSDTLSDVTGRGASTSDQVTLSGGLIIGGNVETADSSNINFADAITANTGTSQFYNLQVNNEISLGGAGSQYLAFNEDSVKVKFANWYSSNDRQYGQGQLWYEMFFAAVDNTDTQDRRRIGFYLEKPNKGASNAEEGSGAHPNNHRAFVDVDSFTLSNKNPLRFEEAIDDSSNIYYTQLQGQSALSANRTITLPDATGTVALTSDITLSTLSVTATATELNHLDGITGITLGSANETLIVDTDGNSITTTDLLAFDTGNNRVGIGTTSPATKFHIAGEGSANEGQIRLQQAYDGSDGPDFAFYASRGTIASPTSTANNDTQGRINAYVHNGTSFVQSGSFGWSSDGTDGDNTFDIRSRVSGTIAKRIEITATGVVQVPGDLEVQGTLNADRIQSSGSNADIVLEPQGTGVVRITSNILPDTTTTYDIGSDSLRFNDIYLAGTTVDIGGTKLQRTTSGDVEIKEGSNRKKLLVDEIHIGQGNNLVKLKRGNNGKLKQLDNSDNDLPILTVVGDDSSGTDFNAGEDIKIAGGTNITTAMSGDTLTVTGATDIVANNITSNDSSAIRINDGLSMAGHIIPAGDSYDLGSASSPWRDVYVSAGSLYVNNKQVLLDDSGTITVQTDADENLVIKTSGTGQTTVQSAAGVNITASSSADITLTTSTGNIELKGTVEVLTGKQITDSAGTNVQFGDNIHMNNNKITNVSDPTADQDVATKAYVDSANANTGDITFNGSTVQSPSNADITMDPGGTGTVTSESDIVIKSRNDIVLNDSDNSAHISLRAPNAVTTSTTLTLPDGAGTSGQVLSTDGAGVLSWADSGGGGGSGASYPNSTVSTMPGSDGDYDLGKNAAQTVSETPFEAGGTDAFGVNLGTVFDMMDPIGTTETTDLGDGEAYVGA